jgi:coiled-coil domain-containing protein 130
MGPYKGSVHEEPSNSQGTLNKFVATSAGHKPKRWREGTTLVRCDDPFDKFNPSSFEMPFNIWCTTCNAHIGQGVRYNAEKKPFGRYLTTRIYLFRMRCHLCSGTIMLKTDPKVRHGRCAA